MQITEKKFQNQDVVYVELDIREYDKALWMRDVIVNVDEYLQKNDVQCVKPLVVSNPYDRIIYSEVKQKG